MVKGPCGGSQDTAGTLLQRDQAAVLGRFLPGLAKRPVAVAVPGPLGCRQSKTRALTFSPASLVSFSFFMTEEHNAVGHSTSHVCNGRAGKRATPGESHSWKAGLLSLLSSPPSLDRLCCQENLKQREMGLGKKLDLRRRDQLLPTTSDSVQVAHCLRVS